MTAQGNIYGINGPIIYLKGDSGFQMNEMVYVGTGRLVGEVIGLTSERTTIEVYEETTGLKPGEPVAGTGAPVSATLAPGILTSIFDGIERPLNAIQKESGCYIDRGIHADSLDTKKKWHAHMTVKKGDRLYPGAVIAEVPETRAITHKVMVPPDMEGFVLSVAEDGDYTIEEPLVTIQKKDGSEAVLSMTQKWPIRVPRPVSRRYPASRPLITGQRIVDTLFPLAKGGTAAIPGGFGTGKTMMQHQIAKWSDADIIIYIGCGERGNEMTDVLMEFPELKDPNTGESIMKRTVLIANTSDMPVAAREASIYTGITIAEYFRDMGYSVAIMADSTSRWAEALREMSGRLEEMPGEEGYPAYLASRLAQFYERAGRTISLGKEGRLGALSAIGAVSPPGGDISEPVSQATLRIVKVFWCLDSSLAYKRHFPAINWLQSYSLYVDRLEEWYAENVNKEFPKLRAQTISLLQEESELQEVVQLVGVDGLSPEDRLKLEVAKSIREDYLHQNAFHEVDTYSSLNKQYKLLKLILSFHRLAREAVAKGAAFSKVMELPIRETIGRFKYVEEKDVDETFDSAMEEMKKSISALTAKEAEDDD